MRSNLHEITKRIQRSIGKCRCGASEVAIHAYYVSRETVFIFRVCKDCGGLDYSLSSLITDGVTDYESAIDIAIVSDSDLKNISLLEWIDDDATKKRHVIAHYLPDDTGSENLMPKVSICGEVIAERTSKEYEECEICRRTLPMVFCASHEPEGYDN